MDIQRLRGRNTKWKVVALQIVTLLILQTLGTQSIAASNASQHDFPRLGGYQIGGWAFGNYEERLDKIAKLDVAVIGLFVDHNVNGYSIADITSYVKSRNSDLKLLQYVIINEVDQTSASFSEIREKAAKEKGAGGKGDWYARNAAGQHVWDWPGTWMLNFSDYTTPDANGQRFPEWLADWFSEKFFEVGGQWDGFFIDVMNVEPQKDHDWDLDGDNDSRKNSEIVDKYTAGQMAFHDRFMARYPDFIGMGNIADWHVASNPLPSRYYQAVSGLLEGIAGLSWSHETWGGFDAMMDIYNDAVDKTADYMLFHVVGDRTDYKFMRYTLAACLMNDGYYTHTTSESYHEQAWFDEFDVNLGAAVQSPQSSPWSKGVYRRDFERGTVLVNPRGNGTQTVSVGGGLKRINGTQDPGHNDGSSASSVTLAAGDGIILLKENVTSATQPKPPVLN